MIHHVNGVLVRKIGGKHRICIFSGGDTAKRGVCHGLDSLIPPISSQTIHIYFRQFSGLHHSAEEDSGLVRFLEDCGRFFGLDVVSHFLSELGSFGCRFPVDSEDQRYLRSSRYDINVVDLYYLVLFFSICESLINKFMSLQTRASSAVSMSMSQLEWLSEQICGSRLSIKEPLDRYLGHVQALCHLFQIKNKK